MIISTNKVQDALQRAYPAKLKIIEEFEKTKSALFMQERRKHSRLSKK